MRGVINGSSIIIEKTTELLTVLELSRIYFFVGYSWNDKLTFLAVNGSIVGMGGGVEALLEEDGVGVQEPC